MVTILIPIRELHARTGHYVRLASRVTEVIITENGKPAARIAPLQPRALHENISLTSLLPDRRGR
jgi:prevent-host-death family protein